MLSIARKPVSVSTGVPAAKQVAAHVALVHIWPLAQGFVLAAAHAPAPLQKRALLTVVASAHPAAAHITLALG
jgi:hypothetical protein